MIDSFYFDFIPLFFKPHTKYYLVRFFSSDPFHATPPPPPSSLKFTSPKNPHSLLCRAVLFIIIAQLVAVMHLAIHVMALCIFLCLHQDTKYA